MSDRPRCGNCVWFEPESGSTNGRCMYDPPVPHLAVVPSAVGQPRPVVQGIRPPVGPNERCHKWQKSYQWKSLGSDGHMEISTYRDS